MAAADFGSTSSIHSLIGIVNGQEWLSRWKTIHSPIQASELASVTLNAQRKNTDLAGQAIYAKESEEQGKTRYDIVNAWQVNYVRGKCTVDGLLLKMVPECYDDEGLFRDFFTPRQGSCVLDVGCNTGKNLSRALHYGGPSTDVWGIEYSEDSVEIARKTHGDGRIVQGDASSDFVGEHGWQAKFSVVQCTAVLQHMTPQQVELAFQNMAKCLAPSGELLLTFKDAPTKEQLQDLGMGHWAEELFTADLVSKDAYQKDGYLRAVMWDDDYYPGVTSMSPPHERDVHLPGNHAREFVFYSLSWIKECAGKCGLQVETVEVCPDSKIPYSALHWKVVFRARDASCANQ